MVQISGPCNALAELAGACRSGYPRRNADRDRAENRECDLPYVRRHEVLRDAMRRVVAGNAAGATKTSAIMSFAQSGRTVPSRS